MWLEELGAPMEVEEMNISLKEAHECWKALASCGASVAVRLALAASWNSSFNSEEEGRPT